MGIATEMKTLTRDITSSHRTRTRRLGEIKRETKQSRGEALHLIEGFHAPRRREVSELRRNLARGVTERKTESKQDLGAFQTSRREQGSQTRKDLSRAQADRKSDTKEILGGFRTSRREEGSKVRQHLVQGLAKRRSQLVKMRGDTQKAQAEVKADLKEAKTAWQGLAATIKVSKGKTETALDVKAPSSGVDNSDLEIKMLTIVREHPEGITLVKTAAGLGVAPVILGLVSKRLIKKGMIRKNAKLYFPVNGK
jgi:hypothetical protein